MSAADASGAASPRAPASAPGGGRALIGHTGFVGGVLDRARRFDHRFNSRTFRDMAGRRFDEVVCAGVSAVKWWANQNPEADWAAIAALRDVLATVETARFTLISTVDVYARPVAVDETTPVPAEGHPYGRHRRLFERFVEERFGPERVGEGASGEGASGACMVVRLPGLFGQGLKKNLIFDALAGGDLSGFHRDSAFQFYDLDRLADDLDTARAAGLRLVNLAVEPVTVRQALRAVDGRDWTRETEAPPLRYDMRTVHAATWGLDGPYLQTAEDCLARIARFADAARAAAAP